ncbi:putative F-box protein At3g29830 [Hevea brasiliensis]|uniref:putative F-box protein At3g29830 n=1 Tax=Hevea brasiliensis TaxID=3981 RepID=UPI0025D0F0AB|nr:putative F-box protein At3g29830 [Hevea brasiliensis]
MKKPTASCSTSKRSFKTMNNNNQDMFSMLSSHLLVLIVSYLPLKEAARTSILSKQWRDIWRQTTNLEFHEKSFVNLKETNENQRIQRSSFFDFIRRLLASYPKKDIQKFSLACSKPKDFLIDIQNFVIFAISRNVRELELDFSDPTWKEVDDLDNHPAIVELPSQVYQHVGLETLKLFSCNFDASRLNNFPNLKRVSLGWLEINVVSFKALLLRFPLLESFNLKKVASLRDLYTKTQA